MANDVLILVITPYGRFVGKQLVENEHNMFTLVDTVEFTLVHDNRGMGMIGMPLGTTEFIKQKSIRTVLDNKSQYFIQYYQATSGISTAPSLVR